jgi:hypothetical protein
LDTLLSVEQAAERLGTSTRVRASARLRAPHRLLEGHRHVRICPADLDAFIAVGRVNAKRREAG